MRWLSSRWKIAVMVIPALVLFTVFIAYPVVYSLIFSFTKFDGFKPPEFNGLDNYATLFDDKFFWRSLGNTGIIFAITLIVLIPLAFALALLMQRRIPGAGALRALQFAPAIIAPILSGLIWIFILDPHIGLLNRVLGVIGLPQPEWIGGNVLSPFSVAWVFMWTQVGFAMTIFYAGLRLLPVDVLEASELDGAGGIKRVWYVIVPMIRETFIIITVLMITGVFKVFEIVYVLTGGGPIHASETLVSYTYFITFTGQRYGLGMASAVIVTALGMVVGLAYLVIARRRQTA
ncbi:MAG: transporter permease [Schumannella sp.]|nr:transporter permease [Schumannella sp.]